MHSQRMYLTTQLLDDFLYTFRNLPAKNETLSFTGVIFSPLVTAECF